jgi:hypothetical protein
MIDSFDDTPKEITIDDINNLLKSIEEILLTPPAKTICPSCGEEIFTMCSDYFTGQCQECFHQRKPWCSSAPIRNAFFKVDDAQ